MMAPDSDSVDDLLPSVPDAAQAVALSGKRGLDLNQIEFALAKQQEKDLRLIYRVDQIQAFMSLPEDKRKRFNFERKPSDPLLIQLFWEAHRKYQGAREPDVQLKWFKNMMDLLKPVLELRKEAMDRMHMWKRYAEQASRGVDDLPDSALEVLAGEQGSDVG